MKDKGVGDTIERFTKATGIKKLVNKIPGGFVDQIDLFLFQIAIM